MVYFLLLWYSKKVCLTWLEWVERSSWSMTSSSSLNIWQNTTATIFLLILPFGWFASGFFWVLTGNRFFNGKDDFYISYFVGDSLVGEVFYGTEARSVVECGVVGFIFCKQENFWGSWLENCWKSSLDIWVGISLPKIFYFWIVLITLYLCSST